MKAGEFVVANIAASGAHGVRIYGPLQDKEAAMARIEAAGAIAATEQDAETARIENFVPRFGCEISDHTLPQETQLTNALHFQKGCYLGQEIVERIRSRGHVNRLLMGFRIELPATAPAGGHEADGGRAARGRGDLFGGHTGSGVWDGVCAGAGGTVGSHGGDRWACGCFVLRRACRLRHFGLSPGGLGSDCKVVILAAAGGPLGAGEHEE